MSTGPLSRRVPPPVTDGPNAAPVRASVAPAFKRTPAARLPPPALDGNSDDQLRACFVAGAAVSKIPVLQVPVEKRAGRTLGAHGFGLQSASESRRAETFVSHVLNKMAQLTFAVQQGAVTDASDVVASWNKPAIPDEVSNHLMSKQGKRLRDKLVAAWTDLANANPAVVVRDLSGVKVSAQQALLEMRLTYVDVDGDPIAKQLAAKQLVLSFPEHPAISNLRHVAGMVGPLAQRSATFAFDGGLKNGEALLPNGVRVEFDGRDLLFTPKAGTDPQQYLDAGLQFFGDTGRLILPSNADAHTVGRYELQNDLRIIVEKNRRIHLGPATPEMTQALARLGFEPHDGVLRAHLASDDWTKLAQQTIAIPDGRTIDVGPSGIQFSSGSWSTPNSILPSRALVEWGNGRSGPPRDANGTMVPGTYQADNGLEVKVSAHNAFELNLQPIQGDAFYDVRDALKAKGFTFEGDFLATPPLA